MLLEFEWSSFELQMFTFTLFFLSKTIELKFVCGKIDCNDLA